MLVVTLALIAVTAVELLRAKPFNVIILTVDSLRASDFTPQTAPNFFKAMQGAVKPRVHRTVSAWTTPNIIAVLTGMSPFGQGVNARGQFLPKSTITPLERLAAKGWKVGSVQAFALADVFKNIGISVNTGVTWKGWLANRLYQGEPFVFWYHYLDVHLPYSPASASVQPNIRTTSPQQKARIDIVRTRSAIPVGSVKFEKQDRPLIRALYLGGVRQFDNWFAGFWDFFKKMELDKDTILVVTADHGDEQLERGRVGHASTTHDASLHEEIVSIPLFILLPQRHPLKKSFRLGGNIATDHLDIMPTVLSLLGEPSSGPLPGRDLTVDQRPRPWFAYSSKGGYGEPDPDNISSFVAAVMLGSYKLIVRVEKGRIIPTAIYNLQADGLEKTNLLRPKALNTMDAPSQKLMGEAGLGRLAAKIIAARRFKPQPEGVFSGSASSPKLLWPAPGAVLSYDDLAGRFDIEWSGDPAADYVLEYEIGKSPFSLSGEMRVVGTRKVFGDVGRHYWETWVVPYGKARIRVRAEGGREWSKWEIFVFQN